MELLLEKQLNRQLTLLQLVHIKEYKPKTIAHMLNISEKTVLSDISDFNESYSASSIHMNSDKNLSLQIHDNHTVESAVEEILQSSFSLYLLKLVLTKEPTLKQTCQLTFFSEPTVRRTILKINKWFAYKKYQMKITIEDRLKVVGDENLIQEFLCILLTELYGKEDFKNFSLIYSTCFDLYCYYKKQKHIELQKIDFIEFSLRFVSLVIRIGLKKKLEFSKELSRLTSEEKLLFNQLSDFLYSKNIFRIFLEKEFNFQFKPENIFPIFIEIDQFYFQKRNQKTSSTQRLIEDIIQVTSQIIPLKKEEVTLIRTNLHETLLVEKKIPYICVDFTHVYYKHLTNLYPQLPKLLEFLLPYLPKNLIVKNHWHYQISITLINYSQVLQEKLLPRFPNKKILILCEKNQFNFLTAQIKYNIPEINEVIICTHHKLKLEYQFINQFNLILLDIPLQDSNITAPTLLLSNFTSENFWRSIKENLS